MNLTRLLAVLIACAPLTARAQDQGSLEVSQHVGRIDTYPSLPAAFPNGVIGWPGVVYSRPEGYRELSLDLYLPPATRSPPPAGYPLVVYIHGGAWLAGDSRHNQPFVDFPGVLASLAARGYVVASVEYRLSGEARFPAQIEDVKSAIGWLRSHSADYHIDPSRAVAWGVSAGGYLAALAATTCGAAQLESSSTALSGKAASTATPTDCVQGAVAWYGLFDFATIASQAKLGSALSRDTAAAPEWRLLGCFAAGCSSPRMAAASPISHVDRRTPPMLLIVGDRDHLIPFQQSVEMADRLKSSGVPYRLVIIPGADHSLMGETLDQTRAANQKALGETFRFVDETLKATPQGTH